MVNVPSAAESSVVTNVDKTGCPSINVSKPAAAAASFAKTEIVEVVVPFIVILYDDVPEVPVIVIFSF